MICAGPGASGVRTMRKIITVNGASSELLLRRGARRAGGGVGIICGFWDDVPANTCDVGNDL